MQNNPVRDWLKAGGVGEDALSATASARPGYSGLWAPSATQHLASILAAHLRSTNVTAVATWNMLDESLAFALALNLGVKGLGAWEDLGVAQIAGPLKSGDSVVGVFTSVTNSFNVAALKALVEQAGAELVALCVLIESPEAHTVGLPVFSVLSPKHEPGN